MTLTKASAKKLATCHPDLIKLIQSVADRTPIVVICGHRSEKEQNAAFASGHSKLQYPKSRHNTYPSQAVDIAPLVDGKINWQNGKAFGALSIMVKQQARILGTPIEWGGDWKAFKDEPHYQLKA